MVTRRGLVSTWPLPLVRDQRYFTWHSDEEVRTHGRLMRTLHPAAVYILESKIASQGCFLCSSFLSQVLGIC